MLLTVTTGSLTDYLTISMQNANNLNWGHQTSQKEKQFHAAVASYPM